MILTHGSNSISRGGSHQNEVEIGGRWYRYVQIGNQVWMAENLAYQTSNSSASADPSYGLLYPWSDLENIPIPNGWRIPSANDVYQLVGTNGSPSTDYRTSSWSNGANTTGFSAVPAGYIDNGRLYTNENLIFTTTRGDLQYALQITDSSGYNKAREVHGGAMKDYKMSVRLIKNVT